VSAAVRRAGTRTVLAAVAALVAVVVGVGAYLVASPGERMVHASAEFDRTTGLYVGSTVRILGVAVGKVTRIEPHGRTVEVDFSYPARYRVPAGAGAVIVPPSIVGDRYLQLTPVYEGGPVLSDGTRIPLDRTAVPVEYDQITASLSDLSVALGPRGANKDGALSRLVDVGAANLDGNGRRLHDTLHSLAQLLGTLDGNKSDLVAVIDHLDRFTTALAADDKGVRAVNQDLAQVATFLSDERGDLDAALRDLSVALREVAAFVHANRDALTRDVGGLAEVTTVLARNQRALAEFLDEAPQALLNLRDAYNPAHHTLDTRNNLDQLANPGQALCQLLAGVGVPCPDQLKHLPTPPVASSNPPSSLDQMLKVRS
jgi:phospholipid/cholesterol/gamma-HCH transport system substrate-binding protein